MLEKKLERVHIERSRIMEYLNVNDLRAMTGLSPDDFHKAIIKELVDNALDACEERSVTPEISVKAHRENGQYHYKITDNGGGMTEEVIRKILNFETRTSSKEAYRAPTRGAQGNALKTVFGISVALRVDNQRPQPIVFRMLNKEYKITIDPNYIADVPEISFEVSNSQLLLDGTEISLAIDLDLDSEDYHGHYAGIYHNMLYTYSLFNPHANFTFNDDVQFKAQNAEFRKFLPTDLTSPHWYTAKDFASLIYGLVNSGHDKAIRDFISDFKNASSKKKQTEILSKNFNGIKRLSDLIQRKELIPELLYRMQISISPQKPIVLGILGEEVLRAGIEARYSFENFYYRKAENTFKIDEAEVPYILEMAVATGCELHNESTRLTVFVGVNNSISYGNPFFTNEYFRYSTQRLSLEGWGLNGFLSQLKVDSYDPVVIVIHLVCPRLEYKDKSKTQMNIQPFRSDLSKLAYLTCKDWFEYKKQLERASQRREHKPRRRPEKISLRDAVFEVLPEAVEIVSSGGKYPFSARNLYYQVRPLLQQLNGEVDELKYEYFTPPLLTEYQEKYGELSGLYYDPRGVLIEPHSGQEIPLGTRDVDVYDVPMWEYNKLLYIEKKGFLPILQQAQIPQRYDLAIMAAEGYATRAAKLVLNSIHKDTEFDILALHDADVDGMMIKYTLEREAAKVASILKHHNADIIKTLAIKELTGRFEELNLLIYG